MPPLVLLTDFGLKDPFVGEMKGVIAKIAPGVPWIDLCHEVPPQNIFTAAWMLYHSYSYFPKGSVFIAVVDPGVGTKRKILLAQVEDYFFVAPDNGLLAPILEKHSTRKLFTADPRFGLSEPSHTFHGRDIFAPLGAKIATGVPLSTLGIPTHSFVSLPDFFPVRQGKTWHGKVAHIDQFGNLITNLEVEKLSLPAKCSLGSHTFFVEKLNKSYQEGEQGTPLFIKSSNRCLEIALWQKSFAKEYSISQGTSVLWEELD